MHGNDYPDYTIPLGCAGAEGRVEHGILICGNGVVSDMNVLTVGCRTMGVDVEWDCVGNVLGARFSGIAADSRKRRR